MGADAAGPAYATLITEGAPLRPYDVLRSWFLSGRERIRLPVAKKMALHKAGARGGTGVSPTPPQKPPLAPMPFSNRGS